MIDRANTIAFGLAFLVWPVWTLGWMPGGFPATVITSGLFFVISYVCYRVSRERSDVQQIAKLRAMQQRYGISDEELLRFVALNPNLDRFGRSLAAKVDAEKHREPTNERAIMFPWIPWSEEETAATRQMVVSIFDKEPSALDSDEAGTLLEILESGRDEKGGMLMIVDKPIAEILELSGSVSMDPAVRDSYGRKRLPEIVTEIGLAEEVIEGLGWGWPKLHRQREG